METGNYIIQLLDKEDINGGKSISFEREYQGKAFNLNVAERDKFTYLFNSIRIENTENLSKLQPEELERRALKLREKVTYLVEDLDVIEMDSTAGVVLLRSKLTKKDTEPIINYFELTINCDRTVSVKRFSHNRQTKVTEGQIFNLTTELAEKFLAHLVETIA